MDFLNTMITLEFDGTNSQANHLKHGINYIDAQD
jgi:uncharacterized DUF497 family protein